MNPSTGNFTIPFRANLDPTPGTSGAPNWDIAVGYDMEIAIPLADLAIPAQSGHVFGFDMFLNDADETVRDSIRNYWSGNNDNWRYANLFGEAVLVGGE